MRKDVREVLRVEVRGIAEELHSRGFLARQHSHTERQTVTLKEEKETKVV